MTDEVTAPLGVDSREDEGSASGGCSGGCACGEVAAAGLPQLLAQLQQRVPDSFEVEYLQRGPEAWRLSLIRKVA